MNDYQNRISCDPKICSRKPCIKGTRIPVHLILDLLAAGEDYDRVRKAYPNITDDDVKACLGYASRLADEESGIIACKSYCYHGLECIRNTHKISIFLQRN